MPGHAPAAGSGIGGTSEKNDDDFRAMLFFIAPARTLTYLIVAIVIIDEINNGIRDENLPIQAKPAATTQRILRSSRDAECFSSCGAIECDPAHGLLAGAIAGEGFPHNAARAAWAEDRADI